MTRPAAERRGAPRIAARIEAAYENAGGRVAPATRGTLRGFVEHG